MLRKEPGGCNPRIPDLHAALVSAVAAVRASRGSAREVSGPCYDGISARAAFVSGNSSCGRYWLIPVDVGGGGRVTTRWRLMHSRGGCMVLPMWHLLGHLCSAHDRLLTPAPIVLEQVSRLGELGRGPGLSSTSKCGIERPKL